ncbi:HAAS signaling domain-containing protein [Geodermatophilus sp. CPCC 206100]|uniref:HAAS signaling domain-containing protein n=1 Tax=Geodermatophilus sp. CPCC 206100 TaxID=3020054 RepID=UPI003B006CD8
MTTSTESYRRELLFALRMRHVPPQRIGEIIAEVESHVADTGESPLEAFGPAKEYAAGFAGPRPRGARTAGVVLTLLGAACGWLIATGVFAMVHHESVAGLPAWVAVAVGALLWVPALFTQLRRQAPVPDPRTGDRLTPGPGTVVLAMSGFILALAAATWLAAALTA